MKMPHAAQKEIDPEVRICGYGHLGDGNIHFNLIEREGGDSGWAQKEAQCLMLSMKLYMRAMGQSVLNMALAQ